MTVATSEDAGEKVYKLFCPNIEIRGQPSLLLFIALPCFIKCFDLDSWFDAIQALIVTKESNVNPESLKEGYFVCEMSCVECPVYPFGWFSYLLKTGQGAAGLRFSKRYFILMQDRLVFNNLESWLRPHPYVCSFVQPRLFQEKV